MSWNLAGWTENNKELRRAVLNHDSLRGDIICINETHLSNNIENQPFLENYTWYGHCRSVTHIRANRTQGGVGIFVHNSLFENYHVSILDKSYDGILGLLFKNKSTNYMFSIYACYLPPENSPYGRDSISFFSHLLSQIYLNNYVDASFTCGDFNSRLGEKQDLIDAIDSIPKRNIIDTVQNKHGDAFLDFLLEAKFIVANGRVDGHNDYTSVSGRGMAVVDYIAMCHDVFNSCSTFEIFPITQFIETNDMTTLVSENCKIPDHSPLSLKFRTNVLCDTEHDTNQSMIEDANVDQCKRYKYNTMSPEFLRSETWVSVLDNLINRLDKVHPLQSEIDEFYDEMTSEVFNEMDKYIDFKIAGKSTRKKYKIHKPFWNDDLTLAWREMSEAEKTYRKCRHGTSHMRKLREEFLCKRKSFDKLLRSTERKFNRKKALEIEQINTSNPVEFWKHISSLGPKKNNSIPMKVYDNSNPTPNSTTVDPHQVLERWKIDFHGLYNMPEESTNTFDSNFFDNIKNELSHLKYKELHDVSADSQTYNQAFSSEELHKVRNKLKNGKSVGPDMLPNEVLKHDGIHDLLLPFINKCFMENIIPSSWRKAIIVPIPKSATKDPYVPLNYRGISLLSCMYKLFTSLINLRVMGHCESNNLLVDEQNGFREKRSCQDHIYTLSTIIKNRKINKMDTYCAFVDFQKAFDWVNRDLLLYKLSNDFQIHGKLFNILSTIYSSSNAHIRLNGILTDSFCVSSGVRQGDIMSPVLFCMYLNDLAVGIKNLNCGVDINGINISILLYADDIVLISKDEKSLQKMLNFTHQWCKKWRMDINADKTQVVHFRNSNMSKTNSTFNFGNHDLKIVGNYKYLGVIFDEFLDFNLNSSTLADSACRALGAIRAKLKNLKEVGYNSFNTLFNAGVLTISEYSAGVWGTKIYPKSEQVQYKAARYFLGVHRFAPIEALLGDMGWATTRTRHKLHILKLWNRLCTLPSDRITSHVFHWDHEFYCNKKGSWSNTVKLILDEILHEEIFTQFSLCDIEFAKTALAQNDTDSWDTKRYNSEKLRYYNLYKFDNKPAEYTFMNISKYQRSLFAQFRCGILPLEIETGRFKGTPLSERICNVCDSGSVEDEIHFLCECSNYLDERTIMFRKASIFNRLFEENDALDKFVYLMANHERSVISFLSKAVKKRCYSLYHVNGSVGRSLVGP